MNKNQKTCLRVVEDSLKCKVCLKNGRMCMQCFDFMFDLFSPGIASPYVSVRSEYVEHYKSVLYTYSSLNK